MRNVSRGDQASEVARTIYPTLAEVGEVGAGHDAARGLVKLLARPAAPVRAAVGIEE